MNKTKDINVDLFESVIAYNVLTSEYYTSIVIDELKPEHLKNPGTKLITSIVFDFYRKRSILPNITEIKLYLVSETEKNVFRETLLKLKSLDTKYNIDELIFNTERFIKERAIYNAVKETAEKYSSNDKEVISAAETLDLFEKACSISLVDDLGLNFLDEIDKFVAAINQQDVYISSGWKWLDEKIGGGFLASGRALYMFMGQTNIGKSIFLGNIASNIASQGKVVVVITLEMPETVYAKRISSKITKIPFRDLQEKSNDLKETLYIYKEQNPNAKIIFKEFPPKGVTVNHIKAYIKKLISKGINPDVIVLDYLNLIAPIEGDNSYEKIKDITEQVRALSYVFKIPFISATQSTRSGYDAEPELQQTSESMGTAHTADVMIGIFQNEEDNVLGILRMSLMKNRFGPNEGTRAMKIHYPTLTLIEDESYFGDDNEVAKTENTLSMLSEDKK